MAVTIALDDRTEALLAAYAADLGHDISPTMPDPGKLGATALGLLIVALHDQASETTYGEPAYPRLAEAASERDRARERQP